MIVVAAPAADPATIHLEMVGLSMCLSIHRPTMIQLCILNAFSGMMPNVRDTTPGRRERGREEGGKEVGRGREDGGKKEGIRKGGRERRKEGGRETVAPVQIASIRSCTNLTQMKTQHIFTL